MLGIVGIVVYGSHCSELVETFSEHTFGVHIGEAEWSYHLCHAVCTAVVFNGLQQGCRNLTVVYEVNPTETYRLAIPTLVGAVVDDGCHTSYEASILVSHIVFGIAELECCILVLAQGVHLIGVEVGHIVVVALIKVIMKFNESLEVATRLNLTNFYC